jgi:hypothetical protein
MSGKVPPMGNAGESPGNSGQLRIWPQSPQLIHPGNGAIPESDSV